MHLLLFPIALLAIVGLPVFLVMLDRVLKRWLSPVQRERLYGVLMVISLLFVTAFIFGNLPLG